MNEKIQKLERRIEQVKADKRQKWKGSPHRWENHTMLLRTLQWRILQIEIAASFS